MQNKVMPSLNLPGQNESLNIFPLAITIFSAANYCDVYHNKGAFIVLR